MNAHEATPVWDPAEGREERQRNEGARMADDCWCPRCGERGFLFVCARCETAMPGGYR